MALLERLQILIDADGKGAVREFQKVGTTADRELSKADDRVRKVSAGLTERNVTRWARDHSKPCGWLYAVFIGWVV